MNWKQRLRHIVYDAFPELDYTVGGSWPQTIARDQRNVSQRLASICSLLERPEIRRGTVVLLAPEGFEGPRFLSQTVTDGPEARAQRFHSTSGSGMEITIPFPLHWPLPKGGWIVSHGCLLSDVFVGNQHQTMGPDGNFCQLRDDVALGVQLRVRVRFDGKA